MCVFFLFRLQQKVGKKLQKGIAIYQETSTNLPSTNNPDNVSFKLDQSLAPSLQIVSFLLNRRIPRFELFDSVKSIFNVKINNKSQVNILCFVRRGKNAVCYDRSIIGGTSQYLIEELVSEFHRSCIELAKSCNDLIKLHMCINLFKSFPDLKFT